MLGDFVSRTARDPFRGAAPGEVAGDVSVYHGVILELTISTWSKSCPDALHYYGTLRNPKTGKVIYEVKRQFSPEAVALNARRRFPRSKVVVQRKIEDV